MNNNNIIYNDKCSLGRDCLLCINGTPEILIRKPIWFNILFVTFYTISKHYSYIGKQWISLEDVYEFVPSHFNLLNIKIKVDNNKRLNKSILDSLNHGKDRFECGSAQLCKNGYWKLKNNIDPWDDLLFTTYIKNIKIKNKTIKAQRSIKQSINSHQLSPHERSPQSTIPNSIPQLNNNTIVINIQSIINNNNSTFPLPFLNNDNKIILPPLQINYNQFT